MITTDYTKAENLSTLKSGLLQSYRLVHWLRDILKNFFSDPINIKDLRIAGLLYFQDNAQLDTLFRILLPYTKDSKKACTTPAIMVSAGDTQYPVRPLNVIPGGVVSLVNSPTIRAGVQHKTIALNIAVLTEDYDGTLLLTDYILNFLVANHLNLAKDNGMISSFSVTSVAAPQQLQTGAAGNAKLLYQSVISCVVVGGISWRSDTQGPVFRGLNILPLNINR